MARPTKHGQSGVYVVGGSYRGRRYRKYSGKNLKAAEREQTAFEDRREMLRKGYPIPPGVSEKEFLLEGKKNPERKKVPIGPPPSHSLRSFMKEYLEAIQPPAKAESTVRVEKVHVNRLLQFLDRERVNPGLLHIDVPFFERYKRWRIGSVTPVTVNKELRTFQTMFKTARRYGYIEKNVMVDVERYRGAEQKRPFLTGKEIEKACRRKAITEAEIKILREARFLMPGEIVGLLEKAEGAWLHGPLACAAYTGMRRGEIAQLRWDDVDLRSRVLTVRSRKQSRARSFSLRSIDIHPDLMEVFRGLKKKSTRRREAFLDERYRPVTPDRLSRALPGLVKDSEFEGIGWHTFRHSFASNLAAEGVDDRIIDQFMGHQTEEMRRRYQHLRRDKAREAIKSLKYKSNGGER